MAYILLKNTNEVCKLTQMYQQFIDYISVVVPKSFVQGIVMPEHQLFCYEIVATYP